MVLKNLKRFLILGVIGLLVVIGILGIIAYAVPRWTRGIKSIQYFDVYHENAINFVLNETDATEKFGNDIKIKSNSRTFTYSPEYANLSEKNKIPHSMEEFNLMIEKISVWVEINQYNKIVVVYEKNQQGELTVTNWYWED